MTRAGLSVCALVAALAGVGCHTSPPEIERNPGVVRPEAAQRNWPVVKVDDSHNELVSDVGALQIYSVPPGEGLVLDAKGYRFDFRRMGLPGVTHPNSVQVVMENAAYSAEWKSASAGATLSAQTLTPIDKSPPFPGFTPGLQLGIIIGYERRDGQTVSVIPVWLGTVNVTQ